MTVTRVINLSNFFPVILGIALTSMCSLNPAYGAVLNSVQNDSVVLANNATSVTDAITAITKNNSFLIFSTRQTAATLNTPACTQVGGEITNSTTLTFYKASGACGAGDITIEWYVAEFTSGVTVEHGSYAFPGTGMPYNIAINAVDTTESFPLLSVHKGGSAYDRDDFITAKITNSTTLQFNATNDNSDATAYYQIVQFTGADVQTDDLTLASGFTSTTDTIPVAINTANSWLIYTYDSPNGTVANIGQKLLRGQITNTTTLTFDRDNSGVDLNIRWYIVEFTDGTTVQQNSEDFTTAQTQQDVVITSVDTTRSIALAGAWYYKGGKSPYNADDIPAVAATTLDLTSSTNLRLTRGLTGTATLDVPWTVVEFSTGSSSSTTSLVDSSGSSTGSYQLGSSTLGKVYISVTDTDENSNAGSTETVAVTVSSNLTGDSESVTLTETGVNTGIFDNTATGLTLNADNAASASNSVLETRANATITASYTDDDDGSDTSTDAATLNSIENTFTITLDLKGGVAKPGDILNGTINITNNSVQIIQNTQVKLTLPQGIRYVENSHSSNDNISFSSVNMVNGVTTLTISSIASSTTIAISFQVAISFDVEPGRNYPVSVRTEN